MSSNKRKSEDIFSQDNRGPAVVVVSATQPEDDDTIHTELQKLRQHELSREDPILQALKDVYRGTREADKDLTEEAASVKLQLEQKLEQARNACQHESRVLIDMASHVENMKRDRTSLIQEMEKLDKQQIDLQRNISQFQEEASQEVESIDQVEEEQKRKVPRLKTQISLYASTTGIKWDFSQDNILSGQVCRFNQNSQHGIFRAAYYTCEEPKYAKDYSYASRHTKSLNGGLLQSKRCQMNGRNETANNSNEALELWACKIQRYL
eukprot:scaffold4617_cov106-Cylindrotheca_fusiformis.AAC.5